MVTVLFSDESGYVKEVEMERDMAEKFIDELENREIKDRSGDPINPDIFAGCMDFHCTTCPIFSGSDCTLFPYYDKVEIQD